MGFSAWALGFRGFRVKRFRALGLGLRGFAFWGFRG